MMSIIDLKDMRERKNKNISSSLLFLKNGKYDIDKYIKFVDEFNRFISHKTKKFNPIRGRHWKL